MTDIKTLAVKELSVLEQKINCAIAQLSNLFYTRNITHISDCFDFLYMRVRSAAFNEQRFGTPGIGISLVVASIDVNEDYRGCGLLKELISLLLAREFEFNILEFEQVINIDLRDFLISIGFRKSKPTEDYDFSYYFVLR